MESTEEDFVRSLSHCVNWQARGGKSGAVFYATEGCMSVSRFHDNGWLNQLVCELQCHVHVQHRHKTS